MLRHMKASFHHRPVSVQVLYIMFCIMLLDYAHDTWFYWTHRFLHLRPIYKYVHFEHHR